MIALVAAKANFNPIIATDNAPTTAPIPKIKLEFSAMIGASLARLSASGPMNGSSPAPIDSFASSTATVNLANDPVAVPATVDAVPPTFD